MQESFGNPKFHLHHWAMLLIAGIPDYGDGNYECLIMVDHSALLTGNAAGTSSQRNEVSTRHSLP